MAAKRKSPKVNIWFINESSDVSPAVMTRLHKPLSKRSKKDNKLVVPDVSVIIEFEVSGSAISEWASLIFSAAHLNFKEKK